jgi:hypothetical protein
MRFKQPLRFVALLALFALLVPVIATAQSIVTGAISGIVSDPTGAVIVGASISLKNPDTGETQAVVSSASGVYNFALLKPGHYNLTVSKEGFKTAQLGVDVILGQIAAANVKLETGSISTTVEVTAAGQLLQTEDANISSNFDTHAIQNIPNPGGDITYIAQTAPGVVMNNSTLGGYGNFSVYGLPGTSNLFTVNGNDYNDPFLNLNNSGASNLLLGGNELQEVTVVSNGYTGQYGRQAGAQLDYTTKSGTNEFHGDAIYNWTGRALNANDPVNKFFGGPRPFENNNQWAARLGGPIKKDKAWFFVNTEGIRYIFGSNASTTTPTADFENYILGNIPQDANTQAFYSNMFDNLYNKAPGIANAARQIATAANPVGSCTGFKYNTATKVISDPITGNPLPAALQDGGCLQNWSSSLSNGNKEWLLSGRVDYNFSDTDKIFGRVKFDRGTQPTYTDPINPVFNNQSIQPQNEGQLNYTHVFSPNVVNNFIGSVLYYSAIFGSQDYPKAFGLFPGILWANDSTLSPLGTGSGVTNGYAGGFFFPQGRNVTQWQLVDDVAVSRGSHSFKMGINWRRDDVSDHTASEVVGYPAVETTLAGFANDQVLTQVQQNFAISPVQPIAFYSFGLYFQDEWRANSKLKFTLVLRADRNSGGACQHSCAAVGTTPFNSMPHGADVPYDADAGGTFIAGRTQILPSVEKVVFEPKFGVAWSPIGDKTVFRGGIGLFTDLYPGTILDAYTTNFPQVNPWTVVPFNSTGTAPATVAFDNLAAGSTLFPDSATQFVQGCNGAFNSNYFSGGNLNSYIASAPAGCATSVPNYNSTAAKILNPKYVEWNFEVQHNFGRNELISVNYVGNHGYDELISSHYANAFCDANCTAAGLTNTGLPSSPIDPRVGTVSYLSNIGYSNYNGVTVSLQENGWHGLSGRFNYSYSHSLDTSSNGGILPFSVITSVLTQINPFNINADYASSDYDARHTISADYVYEIPIKSENRMLNYAVGGWTVSGTFFWHSPFPFSVVDTGTIDGLAPTNNMAGGNILLQPEFSQRNFPSGRTCLQGWITGAGCFGLPGSTATNIFAYPATNFTGNVVGRNAFRGPGFFGGDFSIRKSFNLTERMSFQVGASAYNVFNHANYGDPWNSTTGLPLGFTYFTSTPPTSPYGAFASAATDMRMVQVFGKFFF